MRTLLAERPSLSLLLAGQGVSLLGNQATAFAFSIYVLKDGDHVLLWSFILFSGYACGTLASLACGPLMHAFGSHRLLRGACTIGTAASLILLGLYGISVLDPWTLIITNAISGAAIGFQEPSFVRLLYSIGTEQEGVRLQGLAQAIAAVAYTSAPGVAAVLLALSGISVVLVVDIVSFGVLYLGLRLVRGEGETGAEVAASSSKPTYRRLLRIRAYVLLVVVLALGQLALSVRLTLRNPIVLGATGGDTTTLAIVLTAGSAGGVVGGLLVSWRGGRMNKRAAVACGLIASGLLGQVVFGLTELGVLWSFASLTISAMAPLLAASGYAAALETLPQILRSHGVALTRACLAASVPIAVLLAGPATELVSELTGQDTVGAASIVMVVAGLVAALLGMVSLSRRLLPLTP